MFVTHLNENRTQTNLLEHRKDLLANISNFEGRDKKSCLMWINQLEHAANQAQLPLRQMIAAKAGAVVTSAVNSFIKSTPDATNAQVKQMVLENFLNGGTKAEAYHCLGQLRLDDDESLLAHNAEYGAVHEVAYGISPERQDNQRTLLDYTKSLTEQTSDVLTKKIVRENTKIFTLRQAMDAAIKIHKQARQEEITRLERSTMRETTITDSVNKLSLSEEVNFMPRGDNRFNSTMKSNNGHWNNSPRGRNSHYNKQGNRYNSYSDNNQGNRYNSYSDNNQGNRYNSYSDNGGSRNNQYSDNKSWNLRSNYSSNYDSRRKLRRYAHQPRDSKSNITFKYNISDHDMMPNLRRAVDSLKDEPQANRNKYKQFLLKMSKRNEEEVREDAIAKIKIGQIQEILKEDLDLIFDALVIQDYIDEVEA